ncbi:tetratricopeptide repeat protein [Alsobacter sp. SYSU BS001988]|jgi:tetratricopeptide (TPR) repeat protein
MQALAGATLHIHGRLDGLTLRQVSGLVERAGGRVARRVGASTTHIVLAHSVASIETDDIADLGQVFTLVSEFSLRRALGLGPCPDTDMRTWEAKDLARHARLSEDEVQRLSLFDLLDPVEGRFGFRDLASAREAARLLGAGVEMEALLNAGSALRRRGLRLSEARISEAPWGDLALGRAPHLTTFDGQLTLDLGESPVRVADLAEAAETFEAEGDLARAEGLYRIAARIDRWDPVLPFNLANLLYAQGREAEAMIAYQTALARDPDYVDAYFNLGVLASIRNANDEAERYYRAALETDPSHSDSRFNLALLLTHMRRFPEALALWEELIRNQPSREDLAQARRYMLLCRMEIAAARRPDEAAAEGA